MLAKLLQRKVVRFLICGFISALFNVLLLAALIEFFDIKTPILRNAANAFSIEISLLVSFFIYRAWVWSTGRSTIKEMLYRQIPRYHLSVSASIISRSFLVFPLLDWLRVHYTINTLFGIVLGSAINYKISDKWVFRNQDNS
jgi:dolichol-phosphate mannosyltransferase